MERDFEKEFKQLKQSEVPDLWNRIEAGLTPKNIVSNELETSFIQPDAKSNEKSPEKNPGRMVRARKWALLAAACLCLLIILPALSLTGRKSYSDTTAAETPAADNYVDWNIAEETAASPSVQNAGSAADGYADAAADSELDSYAGAAAESMEENETQNGLADNIQSTQDAQASKDVASSESDSALSGADVSNGIMENAQNADAFEDRASEEETKRIGSLADWDSILQEGRLIGEVKVEILGVAQADKGSQSYTVQVVVVSSDEDDILPKEQKIILMCSEDTVYDFVIGPRDETPLQTGETYTVDLRYEGKGRFAVVRAEKET